MQLGTSCRPIPPGDKDLLLWPDGDGAGTGDQKGERAWRHKSWSPAASGERRGLAVEPRLTAFGGERGDPPEAGQQCPGVHGEWTCRCIDHGKLCGFSPLLSFGPKGGNILCLLLCLVVQRAVRFVKNPFFTTSGIGTVKKGSVEATQQRTEKRDCAVIDHQWAVSDGFKAWDLPGQCRLRADRPGLEVDSLVCGAECSGLDTIRTGREGPCSQ